MDTIYNVGDKVYLEAKIEGIIIDRNGVVYRITYHNNIDSECSALVKGDILNDKT